MLWTSPRDWRWVTVFKVNSCFLGVSGGGEPAQAGGRRSNGLGGDVHGRIQAAAKQHRKLGGRNQTIVTERGKQETGKTSSPMLVGILRELPSLGSVRYFLLSVVRSRRWVSRQAAIPAPLFCSCDPGWDGR